MKLHSVGQLLASIVIMSVQYQHQPVMATTKNSTTIILERFSYLLNKTSGNIMRPVDYLNLNHIYAPNDSYLESKSALSHLYDIEMAMSFENPVTTDLGYSNIDDLKLSAYPVSNQSLCKQQLEWIVNESRNMSKLSLATGMKSLRLAEYLDSFGRPEAATQMGNFRWFGSYKECIKTKLLMTLNHDKKPEFVQTRYCIGQIRPTIWDQFDDANVTRPRISGKIGICLPESCDTSSYQWYKHLIEQITMINFSNEQKSIYKLEGIYCLPDERSPLRQLSRSTYIYIGVVGCWIAIVTLATILYEVRKHIRDNSVTSGHNENIVKMERNNSEDISVEKKKNSFDIDSILEAINVRANIKCFMAPLAHRYRVNLIPMDFFKVLCSLLIIMGHTYHLSMVIYDVGMFKVDQFTQAKTSLGVSIPLVVDTFFTFGGFISTFIIMKKFSLSSLAKPVTWLAINFHIFLRLAPVYLLVYCYARLVSVYTGSGPRWDYGTYNLSYKYICHHEEWWRSTIYLGSLSEHVSSLCVVTSWFVVAYAQCCLLIPTFTFILWRVTKNWQRVTVTITCVLLSSVMGTYTFYNQTAVDFKSFSTYGPVLVNLLLKFGSNDGYTNAIHRFRAVFIGCLGGYYLYQYDVSSILKWPWWMRKITLKLIMLVHLLIIFAPMLSYIHYQYYHIAVSKEQIVYGQLMLNLVWPCINVLFLLRLVTDLYHKSILVRFAGHKFWHLCNKLTYVVYLIHYEIINYAITSYQHGPNKSDEISILKDFCFVLVFTLVIALLLHILFESPINRLIRFFTLALADKQNSAMAIRCSSPSKLLSFNIQQQVVDHSMKCLQKLKQTKILDDDKTEYAENNANTPSAEKPQPAYKSTTGHLSFVKSKCCHRRSPTLSMSDIKLEDSA